MGHHEPDPRRVLRTLAFALLMGSTTFLGVALLIRSMGHSFGAVPFLEYVAVAVAVMAPLIAGAVKNQITAGHGAQVLPAEKARAAVIVPLAILESAAFLCGLALLLTPSYLPLAAAVIPIAGMLFWFPR